MSMVDAGAPSSMASSVHPVLKKSCLAFLTCHEKCIPGFTTNTKFYIYVANLMKVPGSYVRQFYSQYYNLRS